MTAAENIDIFVGNKIRERRKQLKLSQDELSKILNISYQQVQKYESGNTPLTIGRLFQVAQALNATPGHFHEGAPTNVGIGQKIESDIIIRERTKILQILLVEDNAGDEALFCKAVSQCGGEANVTAINEPEKVIDYVCNSEIKYGTPPPDLIVMDINMPRIDGLELLKNIKKNQSISHIPVVMLTNSVRSADMEKAYKLQASSFIQKPALFDDFSRIVASIVQYWSKTAVLT